jgi:hypothetical protein
MLPPSITNRVSDAFAAVVASASALAELDTPENRAARDEACRKYDHLCSLYYDNTRQRSRSVEASRQRRRRRTNAVSGYCVNAKSHDKPVSGQMCDACKQRQKRANLHYSSLKGEQ